MFKHIRPVIALVAVVLSMMACNLPGAQGVPSVPVDAASPTRVKDVSPNNTPTLVQNPAVAETATSQPEAPSNPVQPAVMLPAGPLKIVAIGDSLTQGDGDDSGVGGYPPRLLARIEESHPGSQMFNFGRSGWTSLDVLNGVNGEAATLPQALEKAPNIAIVWIGSNDLWYLYEYGPEPMTAEAEKMDLARYAENLDSMLSQLQQSGALIFVALLDDQSKRSVVANPPNPAEPAFTAISTAELGMMSEQVKAYNQVIMAKAAEYGAVPVDFYHTDIFTNPNTIYSDGNHPSTNGYEMITGIWLSAMAPYLGN